MGTKNVLECGKLIKLAQQADSTRECLRSILVRGPNTEDLLKLDAGIRILDSALGCLIPKSIGPRCIGEPDTFFVPDIDRIIYHSVIAHGAPFFWRDPEEIENAKRLLCSLHWDIKTKGTEFNPNRSEIASVISAFGGLNQIAVDKFNELR